MCNIWNKEHVRPELSPEDIGRFFSRPHGVFWLGITGGEPFLRPDLFAVVDAALASSPSLTALHFATNGTLTSRVAELVDAVRKKYPKLRLVFTISIDGPPDLHDRIRGVPGAWDKAVATWKMLRAVGGVKPQFGFTLSRDNIGRFADAFAALRAVHGDLRFDDVTVNIFQRSGFYYENTGMPALDPDAVRREIAAIKGLDHDGFSLNNFLRRRYLKLYLEYLVTQKSPVKCQSMASTCFLDPYGDLYPCAVYQRRLVNIRETSLSLRALWQLPEARDIHAACAANHCPSCWSPCDAYSAIAGSLIPAVLK
jgi:radical SAM protein with 4Fe4S-binding SPASM domain